MNSDVKHTPGPWEAMGPNGKYFVNHGWTVDHEDEPMTQTVPVHRNGYVVAMVVDADGDDGQFAANARLIAAAPDLLEACKAFAEWLRREEDGFPGEVRFNTPDGDEKWRQWFYENIRICDLSQKLARAAIAKATGAP